MAQFAVLLIWLGLASLAQAYQNTQSLVQAASYSEATSISKDEAIKYLKQWRPTEDGMTEAFFQNNAEFSLKAQDLPYAKQVPKSMFLTYVLPYSHFDEPRDAWRQHMYETLLPFVKEKQTVKEAAEALFPAWGNAFGKQLQFKGNMTPQVMAPLSETLEKGYASCTGMSIFLANCMRAVGIPARIVGVGEWNRPEKGNHNWVEIWVGDHWNFVDAVPGGAVTWNQTWFSDQAKQQSSWPATHAILSPLWGPEANTIYPMTWRTPAVTVPAIDVTANYAGPASYHKFPLSSYVGAIVCMAIVALVVGFYVQFYMNRKCQGYEPLP